MSKVKMIAQKRMRYSTRRLVAGDAFESSGRDSRLLEKLGLASIVPRRVAAPVAPPPPDMLVRRIDPALDAALSVGMNADIPPPAPRSEVEDIAMLRTAYREAVGRKPFMGWGASELRTRIKAARG